MSSWTQGLLQDPRPQRKVVNYGVFSLKVCKMFVISVSGDNNHCCILVTIINH